MNDYFNCRLCPMCCLIVVAFAFLAVWPSMKNNLVESSALHLWRGRVVLYSGKDVTMNLMEAEDKCSKMGGKLPSVHSKEDVNELIQIIGRDSRLWLGSKPQDNSSPTMPRGVYEWTDGSPFNYDGWVSGSPDCSSTCCGVGMTTISGYGQGMYDIECSNQRSLVCVMPILTRQGAQDWIQSEMSKFNSTTKQSVRKNLEQQLSIDVLNETMINMQHLTIFLFQQFTRIENHFKESLFSLNGSLTRNDGKIKQIVLSMKRSLAQETEKASQVGHQNRSDLDSLSSQIDFCFSILSLVLIVMVVAVVIKVNLISWTAVKHQSVAYARYIRRSMSSHLPSAPPKKVTDSPEYETIEHEDSVDFNGHRLNQES